MSPPHIPKIGATTVPPAASPRAGGQGPSAQQRQAGRPEAPPPLPVAETAVVVNRSLELLETMAGRVSEATGESIDARGGGSPDGDSAYRVQLMSFIVGSLSRASNAFRQKAVQTQEEPEPEPKEVVEEDPVVEEVEVEAALPEQAMAEPVQEAPAPVEAAAPAPVQEAPLEQPTGYGRQGQAVQEPGQDATVKRWA